MFTFSFIYLCYVNTFLYDILFDIVLIVVYMVYMTFIYFLFTYGFHILLYGFYIMVFSGNRMYVNLTALWPAASTCFWSGKTYPPTYEQVNKQKSTR